MVHERRNLLARWAVTRPRWLAREHGQMTTAADPLAFTCPRCGSAIEAVYYGPCPDCRAGLRASMGSDGRAVERSAFEPAMHVTPNAVAQKD